MHLEISSDFFYALHLGATIRVYMVYKGLPPAVIFLFLYLSRASRIQYIHSLL